jgi:hypothetical protein
MFQGPVGHPDERRLITARVGEHAGAWTPAPNKRLQNRSARALTESTTMARVSRTCGHHLYRRSRMLRPFKVRMAGLPKESEPFWYELYWPAVLASACPQGLLQDERVAGRSR